MAIRFFGQWLLERGHVNSKQLLQALDLQSESNRSLGELAVEAGWLDEAQAQTINNEQKSTDKRFGEIALSQSLLSDDQVMQLLTQQRNRKRFLGEILVDIKAISVVLLEQELAKHKAEQDQIHQSNNSALQALHDNALVEIILNTQLALHQRIIHRPLQLSSIDVKRVPALKHTYEQVIHPDPLCYMRLSLCDSEQQHVIDAMLKAGKLPTSLAEDPAFCEDICKEFLNTVMGNATMKLKSIERESNPQAPISLQSEPGLAQVKQHISCTMIGPDGGQVILEVAVDE